MEKKTHEKSKLKISGIIAGGGAASGLAALIAASCCILPLILINLGVSSAMLGNLAFFAKAKPYFIAITALLIGLAFVSAFWNGRRPSRRVGVVLAIATLLSISAIILPNYEAQLIRWLNL